MKCNEILIVEDDKDIRDILKTSLELEGYNVKTAENGKEGLEILSSMNTPCLILLDLMMPVMDGWAFAEAMGKDMQLTAIPIIVVTAFSKEDTSRLKKVKKIIKKPIDLDLLLSQVDIYCGRVAAHEPK
jgi:CheY-like chemotaxis protein